MAAIILLVVFFLFNIGMLLLMSYNFCSDVCRISFRHCERGVVKYFLGKNGVIARRYAPYSVWQSHKFTNLDIFLLITNKMM